MPGPEIKEDALVKFLGDAVALTGEFDINRIDTRCCQRKMGFFDFRLPVAFVGPDAVENRPAAMSSIIES